MVTPVLCQICRRPVMLETARINEHGKAVHEECYVNALRATQAPAPDDPSIPKEN